MGERDVPQSEGTSLLVSGILGISHTAEQLWARDNDRNTAAHLGAAGSFEVLKMICSDRMSIER